MLKELTDQDITNIIEQLGLKINGIYSKDKTPKLEKGFYVINLQDSDDGNGTHWTCLYYLDSVYSYYFDSFGFPPPQEIQNKLKNYVYSNKQIQDINSSACGYYCIGFIKFMTGKKDIEKAYKIFTEDIFSDNTKKNDYILTKFLNLNKS